MPGSPATPVEDGRDCWGLWPEKGPRESTEAMSARPWGGSRGRGGVWAERRAEEARADRGWLNRAWGPWGTSGEEGSRGHAGPLQLPRASVRADHWWQEPRKRELHGVFLNSVVLCIGNKHSRKRKPSTYLALL